MPERIDVQKNNFSNGTVIKLKKSIMHSQMTYNIEQYKNKNISFLVKSRSTTKEDFLELIQAMIESYEELYGK